MSRVADNLLIAVLVVTAIGLLGETVHHGHVYALMLSTMLVYGFSQPNKYVAAFISYVTCYIIYVMYFAVVYRSATGSPPTLIFLDAIVFIFLGIVLYAKVLNSRISKEKIYNTICVLTLFETVISLLQAYSIDPIYSNLSYFVAVTKELKSTTPIGTLGNPNFVGAFIAISIPFFFRKYWWFLLPVVLIGLFNSQARMAVIAAIGGCSYFFSYLLEKIDKKYRASSIALMSVLVVGFVLCYLFYLDHRNFGDRTDMWIDAVKKVSSSWQTLIFGFGPNAVWKVGDQLHSIYFTVLFNYGVVGLFILLSLIYKTWRGNRILYSAFLIVCINGIGNHVLYTAPTAALAIFIFGLIERERTTYGIK